MSKDMCVVCDDGILNIRAGAIIIKDGKLLMVGNDRDYDNYYSHLQNAIDSIKTNGVIENVDALRTAFKAIIPTEAIELYKRICPSFLELIKE